MIVRLQMHHIIKPCIFSLLACWCGLASAAPWRSDDGKVVEADFVRLEAGYVILRAEDRQFPVLMDRLDAESRAFALHMQDSFQKWAEAAAAAPYLTEPLLHDLMNFDPALLEMKSFFVYGKVASIERTGSALVAGTGAQFELTFNGGIVMPVDFADEVRSTNRRLRFDDDQVTLEERPANYYVDVFGGSNTRRGSFRQIKTLASIGNLMTIKVEIQGGKITKPSIPTQADLEGLPRVRRWDAHFERMQARANFIDERLEDKPLKVAEGGEKVVLEYSMEDKIAMHREMEILRITIEEDRKKIRF